MAAPGRSPGKALKRDPLSDVGDTLGSMALTLEGVAEGLRQWCQRSTTATFTNADHGMLAVLYERLDVEAETLKDVEKRITEIARVRPTTHPPKGA